MQTQAEDTFERINAMANSRRKQGPSAIQLEGLESLQEKYKGIVNGMESLFKSLRIKDHALNDCKGMVAISALT